MAGHSKWKNIQHRKGAQDKKKGKIFTKLNKEISVAVKESGADPETNPRLRLAIQNARSANMPKDNIDRAIKKASGNDGEHYVEVTFEGYGPGGVALFIEAMTDNNTRTVSNIRSYFTKNGGSLGKDGCLQFVFERKGAFLIKASDLDEDEFSLEAIDAGAEDVEFYDGKVNILCQMEEFGNISKWLANKNIEAEHAGLERIANDTKSIDLECFKANIKLIDKIEDDDDVQKVYHNIEITQDLENQIS